MSPGNLPLRIVGVMLIKRRKERRGVVRIERFPKFVVLFKIQARGIGVFARVRGSGIDIEAGRSVRRCSCLRIAPGP